VDFIISAARPAIAYLTQIEGKEDERKEMREKRREEEEGYIGACRLPEGETANMEASATLTF
jgi:hypothetical protein